MRLKESRIGWACCYLKRWSGKTSLSRRHLSKAPEGSEGVRQAFVWRKYALGGRNSKCKGSEADVYWVLRERGSGQCGWSRSEGGGAGSVHCRTLEAPRKDFVLECGL